MTSSVRQEGVTLRIPGETRYLALVRMVVTELARTAGVPDFEVDKIEIAVDEACTNVMDHAYRNASPKPPINVDIQLGPGQFVVDVIDQGTPFDYNAYVPPKFPDHWLNGRTRGVGLYIIRKCMDEARYDQLPGKTNRLRLIKRFQPAA